MNPRPAVSVVRCPDYDLGKVREAVRESVDRLGGIGRFVKPGERVLVKVNLLFPSKPEEAVTTHPSVVRAVVELVEEAGGRAVVADSPGLQYSKARLEKAYRKCGMYEAVEGTSAELNWDLGTAIVQNPQGMKMKRLEVIKALEDADRVIALPKPKTHTFQAYTGATKVLYGVLPGLVKAAYHSKLPDPAEFADMLLDIQEYVGADLFVMDAVVGMDGKGPSAGRPKKVGAVLASADPLAMDLAALTMVGMDPMSVYTINRAVARGMTSGRVEDLEILGERPESFGVKFEPAMESNIRVPKLIMDFVGNRYTKKPVPDPARCVGCGACVLGCPRHCIRLVNEKARVDQKCCIRCYCCHELCPERAVDLK